MASWQKNTRHYRLNSTNSIRFDELYRDHHKRLPCFDYFLNLLGTLSPNLHKSPQRSLRAYLNSCPWLLADICFLSLPLTVQRSNIIWPPLLIGGNMTLSQLLVFFDASDCSYSSEGLWKTMYENFYNCTAWSVGSLPKILRVYIPEG
jgi:hypothetical protein